MSGNLIRCQNGHLFSSRRWLAYETMAIDADIFNIMFITPLEGKMLYGSFNCILGMQDEWEKIAMYCIRTIKKVEEE